MSRGDFLPKVAAMLRADVNRDEVRVKLADLAKRTDEISAAADELRGMVGAGAKLIEVRNKTLHK